MQNNNYHTNNYHSLLHKSSTGWQ